MTETIHSIVFLNNMWRTQNHLHTQTHTHAQPHAIYIQFIWNCVSHMEKPSDMACVRRSSNMNETQSMCILFGFGF